MTYLEKLSRGHRMKIAQIKKDCPVSIPELYIYTGVSEGVINEMSA
jgi:hypothetical protein